MITDHTRDGYIGASDTHTMLMGFHTQTFKKWWGQKLGILPPTEPNIYMTAGNIYEHPILDYLGIEEKDGQTIVGRLRVNFDGRDKIIHEVKTHKAENVYEVSKAHWEQCQVEMWADCSTWMEIVAYGLTEEDYEAAELGFALTIDPDRLTRYPIEHDDEWIENIYLPRLRYLSYCLDNGVREPNQQDYEEFIGGEDESRI